LLSTNLNCTSTSSRSPHLFLIWSPKQQYIWWRMRIMKFSQSSILLLRYTFSPKHNVLNLWSSVVPAIRSFHLEKYLSWQSALWEPYMRAAFLSEGHWIVIFRESVCRNVVINHISAFYNKKIFNKRMYVSGYLHFLSSKYFVLEGIFEKVNKDCYKFRVNLWLHSTIRYRHQMKDHK
jgi:hypothetical protein